MSDTYQRAKEGLTRAAYRALLNREADDAAAAAMAHPSFQPHEEEELRATLASFLRSEEFRSLQIPRQDAFQLAKEAMTRAAYGALLSRGADEQATAVMTQPAFSPDEEEELKGALAQFLASEEYLARQIPRRDAFILAKEALTRAAYRALLLRDVDDAAAAALVHPPFPPEEEDELRNILARFIASGEFRSLVKELDPQPDYPPSTWARVEVDDLLLWVDLGDLGVSRHCVSGSFEPVETSFIRSVVKPGMTFVDVGANIGWFSANAAKLVGSKGRLFAFEPRKDTFSALSRTFQDNGFSDRATLINAAVGEEAGEVFIGWSPQLGNPGGTWTLPYLELEETFRDNGAALERTPVVVLDEVIGDTSVDVMKIDIEGAEPIALRGARGLLRRQRPLILCELNPVLLDKVSRTSSEDFISSVESEGYVCHALGPNGVEAKLDPASVGLNTETVNVVFVPTR